MVYSPILKRCVLADGGTVRKMDIGLLVFLHHEDWHNPLSSGPNRNLTANPNPNPYPKTNPKPKPNPNPLGLTSEKANA